MDSYTGIFMNFSLGRKMQYPRNGIIRILDLKPSELDSVIGWWIGWPKKDPKMFGKIQGFHGKSGNLMARFNHGLPGQAIGTKIAIVKTKSDIPRK